MEALRGSRKVDGSPRCLRTLGGSLLLAVTLVGVGSVPQASSQSDKSTPPFADYQGDPPQTLNPSTDLTHSYPTSLANWIRCR